MYQTYFFCTSAMFTNYYLDCRTTVSRKSTIQRWAYHMQNLDDLFKIANGIWDKRRIHVELEKIHIYHYKSY